VTEEEIKQIAEQLSSIGLSVAPESYAFLALLITLLITAGGIYFTSYFKKSAEIKAINENFKEVKLQLKESTELTEAIKGSIQNDLEHLKASLSRHDHVFRYKLDAYKALNKIWYKLVPKKTSPDMEFDDACEIIGQDFSMHEDDLISYLSDYAPALSNDVANKLTAAMFAASEGQFEFYWNKNADSYDLREEGINSAKELYNSLESALKILKTEIDDLISHRE
jgi:hypothetical protein